MINYDNVFDKFFGDIMKATNDLSLTNQKEIFTMSHEELMKTLDERQERIQQKEKELNDLIDSLFND